VRDHPWFQWRVSTAGTFAAVLLLALAAATALTPGGRSMLTVARHQRTSGATRTWRLRLDKPDVVQPAPTAPVFPGAAADAQQQYATELDTAFEPYRAGMYGRAISRLTALRNRYPSAAEPPFYLGACRLLAGDAEGAIPSFEQAAALFTGARRDEPLWYKAVAEERADRPDAARRTLQDLCSRAGPRQTHACAAVGAFP
jgi:TolA-binding protein